MDALYLDDDEHIYIQRIVELDTLDYLGIYKGWLQSEGLHLYDAKRLEQYLVEQLMKIEAIELRLNQIEPAYAQGIPHAPTLNDPGIDHAWYKSQSLNLHDAEWVASIQIGRCTITTRIVASRKPTKTTERVFALLALLGIARAMRDEVEAQKRCHIIGGKR